LFNTFFSWTFVDLTTFANLKSLANNLRCVYNTRFTTNEYSVFFPTLSSIKVEEFDAIFLFNTNLRLEAPLLYNEVRRWLLMKKEYILFHRYIIIISPI
jgi:hypothetical protein